MVFRLSKNLHMCASSSVKIRNILHQTSDYTYSPKLISDHLTINEQDHLEMDRTMGVVDQVVQKGFCQRE